MDQGTVQGVTLSLTQCLLGRLKHLLTLICSQQQQRMYGSKLYKVQHSDLLLPLLLGQWRLNTSLTQVDAKFRQL